MVVVAKRSEFKLREREQTEVTGVTPRSFSGCTSVQRMFKAPRLDHIKVKCSDVEFTRDAGSAWYTT